MKINKHKYIHYDTYTLSLCDHAHSFSYEKCENPDENSFHFRISFHSRKIMLKLLYWCRIIDFVPPHVQLSARINTILSPLLYSYFTTGNSSFARFVNPLIRNVSNRLSKTIFQNLIFVTVRSCDKSRDLKQLNCIFLFKKRTNKLELEFTFCYSQKNWKLQLTVFMQLCQDTSIDVYSSVYSREK